VNAHDVVDILPPEVVRYFILRYSPVKRLYFDETDSLVRLVDDFAAMRQHPQNELDERLLFLCTDGLNQSAVSSVPFSHLVISYQAALYDTAKTVEILRRSAEYADIVDEEETVIITELDYVSRWLDQWAPESLKFRLADEVNPDEFSAEEKEYLRQLADDIAEAPAEADGNWFHQAIYTYKESGLLPPRELFTTIYRVLIGKDSGPRAGWFLSILPRDWLIDRLRLLK
jgi:lysyl-tRNA synthetase, class I